MKRAIALLLMGFLFFASGCRTEEERCLESGAKRMDSSELKNAFQGNTMSGTIPSINAKFDVYYYPDGRMVGAAASGAGRDSDQGTYIIKDSGELCMRWNRWLGSGCAPVYRLKQEYRIFHPETGVLYARQRLRKGNPENLPVGLHAVPAP